MHVADATEILEKLTDQHWVFADLKMEFGESYHPRTRWFGPDKATYIPKGKANGIYLYTSLDDEIWYIGKAAQKADGGLGRRTCAHLGKPDRGVEDMFPRHEWVGYLQEHPDIEQALTKGDFHIRTITVAPVSLCSLLEEFLQTCCLIKDDRLPPLNVKVG